MAKKKKHTRGLPLLVLIYAEILWLLTFDWLPHIFDQYDSQISVDYSLLF